MRTTRSRYTSTRLTPTVLALLRRSLDYERIRAKVWYLPTVLLTPAVTVVAYGVMRWMGLPLPARQLADVSAWGPRKLARFGDARACAVREAAR
jgi:hypothetical protein